MSYVNPPPEVEAMKNMLLASATWSAMAGGIHYPSAESASSANPDSLPLIVIEPIDDSPRVLAPGIVVPHGKIQLMLTMESNTGADIEKKARAIKDDLSMQLAGLPITDMQVGMASEADSASLAQQQASVELGEGVYNALRTIPIIINYGITG